MQMRYQLRHSPRCCPRVEAPRTTRGILANALRGTNRAWSVGGVEARRPGCTPRAAGARSPRGDRAPPSRSWRAPAGVERVVGPAEQRGHGDPDRRAVPDHDRPARSGPSAASSLRAAPRPSGPGPRPPTRRRARRRSSPAGTAANSSGCDRRVLVVGEPLPLAEVELAQPGVVRRLETGRWRDVRRGVPRPDQVRAPQQRGPRQRAAPRRARAACSWPLSSSSASSWPCTRPSWFQAVRPCRSRTSSATPGR